MSLRLLGGFDARVGEAAPVDFPTKKAEALLIRLARYPGRRVSRESLGALLWEASESKRARTNVRQTLMALRKTLAHGDRSCLVADGDALYLDPEQAVVDVGMFDELCREATPEAIQKAMTLYAGEFVQGFWLESESYEEWLRAERMQLHNKALDVFRSLLRHCVAKGEVDQGIQVATRMLVLDPLQEDVHRALMQLYAESGNRVLALKQYQTCRDLLHIEMDLTPDEETERLHEQIRGVRTQARAPTGAQVAPISVNAFALPDKPSIAVMPFANLSGDAEQAYFSDGITEDIITELSRFRSLFVIARHSSFAYRDSELHVAEIGGRLGVHYVLQGSVRKLGDRVRVTAQLVDAATRHHLWSDRYDRSLADLLDVQDELVRTIVATVGGRIDVEGKRRVLRMSDDSLRAYDCYLRALAAEDQNTKEDYQRARAYLEQAIQLDPGLPQAYHHLSLVEYFGWLEHWADDRERAFAKAFVLGRTAVALDDTDCMAHAHLATLHLFRREFTVAKALFEKALRLNPNESRACFLYGLYLTAIGRPEEAIEIFEKAARLNPLEPNWFHRLRGMAYYTAHRYDEAISSLRLVETPLNEVRGWLAASYAQAGRIDEARTALATFLRVAEQEMAKFPGHCVVAWENYWRGTTAYKNQTQFDHLFDGLRKAGLATK